LLDAIEKMRKILSGNSEAECNCEYLVEDYDLNELLSREEFEKISEPVLNQINQAITTIVQELRKT
jgi:molecular chaperone DnaK (HSP70)